MSFFCPPQLRCAHRAVVFGHSKGCSVTLLLVVFSHGRTHGTSRHWQAQELSSCPDIAQSPSQNWVISQQPHPCSHAASPSATPLLQMSPGLFCPEKGQSRGTGLRAGASCKSSSLASSLLKKLDIRALITANSLLSLPPEKWIILMLTEGFSFFEPCQI